MMCIKFHQKIKTRLENLNFGLVAFFKGFIKVTFQPCT